MHCTEMVWTVMTSCSEQSFLPARVTRAGEYRGFNPMKSTAKRSGVMISVVLPNTMVCAKLRWDLVKSEVRLIHFEPEGPMI